MFQKKIKELRGLVDTLKIDNDLLYKYVDALTTKVFELENPYRLKTGDVVYGFQACGETYSGKAEVLDVYRGYYNEPLYDIYFKGFRVVKGLSYENIITKKRRNNGKGKK